VSFAGIVPDQFVSSRNRLPGWKPLQLHELHTTTDEPEMGPLRTWLSPALSVLSYDYPSG